MKKLFLASITLGLILFAACDNVDTPSDTSLLSEQTEILENQSCSSHIEETDSVPETSNNDGLIRLPKDKF